MTKLRPLVTDEHGARTLQRIIREANDSALTLPPRNPAPNNGSLVVKLLTAITSGSTAPVTAQIMQLNGNTWEASGNTVQVRSATGAAVSTTGRRIARRVAHFGYCVVET